MKTRITIELYTCPVWGAKPPKREPTWTDKPAPGIIFHHTAGHHPEIANPASESYEEGVKYARQIQALHMAPGGLGVPLGGIDSGHNFLVLRNGMIFQGRWRSVRAIQQGKMILSAHCPGFNNWVGIEHEHLGSEAMTVEQREASARLQAWIAGQYQRSQVLPVDPHSAHFNTRCPANLITEIPVISILAQQILDDARQRRMSPNRPSRLD